MWMQAGVNTESGTSPDNLLDSRILSKVPEIKIFPRTDHDTVESLLPTGRQSSVTSPGGEAEQQCFGLHLKIVFI